MIVVADTSPVVALLHLKKIQLLNNLYGQVFIPSIVAIELNTLVQFGYDLSFLEQTDVFIIRSASNVGFVQELSEVLDPGEAEAIVLARELKAHLLLLDEKLGRQFAETEHIVCKGFVGILIDAKKHDLIQLVKPLLDDLVHNLKFRLSDKLYQLALQKAGE